MSHILPRCLMCQKKPLSETYTFFVTRISSNMWVATRLVIGRLLTISNQKTTIKYKTEFLVEIRSYIFIPKTHKTPQNHP